MFALRLRQPLVGVCRQVCSSQLHTFSNTVPKQYNVQLIVQRNYANFTRRPARQRIIQTDSLAKPVGETAFKLGQGVAAGGAVVGLGALCYYGLGLSNRPGIIDTVGLWQPYVKERIQTTYMYFGSSIALTAASAMACFRSPAIMSLVTRGGFLAIAGTFAAMIGSGILVRSIPYKEGIGSKQLAWMLHCGVIGAVVAPMCFLGGPLLMRAAWYTAGIVGGLSTVAYCAPSEEFLNMGGPLAIGLGTVFVASVGSAFLPPTTALGAGLYSVALYGGLVLFSAFLLYDTQKIVKKAETYPTYDPVNASIGIYLDTVNIFIRIATILAGGGGQKRR